MNFNKKRKLIAIASLLTVAACSFTGCGEDDKIATKDRGNNYDHISSAMAVIESDFDTVYPDNEISVSVTEPESIAGFETRIKRDVLTSPDPEKALIETTSQCAKISDTLYNGLYNISGQNLETAKFKLQPMGMRDEVADTYGINYFSVIQKAKADGLGSVDVKYRDEITANAVTGEFAITVDPENIDVKKELGYDKIVIKGDAGGVSEEVCNITCKLTDKGISVESTRDIGEVTVECDKLLVDENGKLTNKSEQVMEKYTEKKFNFDIKK